MHHCHCFHLPLLFHSLCYQYNLTEVVSLRHHNVAKQSTRSEQVGSMESDPSYCRDGMQHLVNIQNTNICTMHRVCISVFNVCNDTRQQIVGKLDLENKYTRTEKTQWPSINPSRWMSMLKGIFYLYLFSYTGVQHDFMWCRICLPFRSTPAV